MSCNKYEFLISKKIDNVITDEELSVLNAHLQNCPKCSKSLELFQKTRNILLSTKVTPKQTSGIKFKVFDKIQQEKEKNKKFIFVDFTRKHLVLAASFLFVVLASLTVWQTSFKNVNMQDGTDYLSWYYEYENTDDTDYNYGYDLFLLT